MIRNSVAAALLLALLGASCRREAPAPADGAVAAPRHEPGAGAAMRAAPAPPPLVVTTPGLPGPTWREPKVSYTFIDLPPGTFRMGCNDDDPDCFEEERRPRLVSVGAFALGRLEVTVTQFAACAATGACPMSVRETDVARVKTCNWKNERWDHPVNCLDWAAARSFCRWLGGDLPTAEQWEYAARSGGSAKFPWGNAPFDATRANSCDRRCLPMLAEPEEFLREGWFDASLDDGFGGTAPVGSFPDGATPWGLLDMAGNVVEWTASRFDATTMELRGGSWDGLPRGFRNSYRDWFDPTGKANQFGVRCAHAPSGGAIPTGR